VASCWIQGNGALLAVSQVFTDRRANLQRFNSSYETALFHLCSVRQNPVGADRNLLCFSLRQSGVVEDSSPTREGVWYLPIILHQFSDESEVEPLGLMLFILGIQKEIIVLVDLNRYSIQLRSSQPVGCRDVPSLSGSIGATEGILAQKWLFHFWREQCVVAIHVTPGVSPESTLAVAAKLLEIYIRKKYAYHTFVGQE
jgi:hypothetical protein